MNTLLGSYGHQDLDEPPLPNGAAIRRPVVTIGVPGSLRDYVAVVDSGSPISFADERLFPLIGIDLAEQHPIYSVPLGMGGAYGSVTIFEVELELRPPRGLDASAMVWRLHLGARPGWRLPFSVLFGQDGWFEHFPTTIDGTATSVRIRSDREA